VQVGDASERGCGGREKGKRRGRRGNGGWSALSRGGVSGAMGGALRASGGRGNLTSGPHLLAALGGR
jgi:hypothetical protein